MSHVPSQSGMISFQEPVFDITREEKVGNFLDGYYRFNRMTVENTIRRTKNKQHTAYVDLHTRTLLSKAQVNFTANTLNLTLADITDPSIHNKPNELVDIAAAKMLTRNGHKILALPDTINAGINGAAPPPNYDDVVP